MYVTKIKHLSRLMKQKYVHNIQLDYIIHFSFKITAEYKVEIT